MQRNSILHVQGMSDIKIITLLKFS